LRPAPKARQWAKKRRRSSELQFPFPKSARFVRLRNCIWPAIGAASPAPGRTTRGEKRVPSHRRRLFPDARDFAHHAARAPARQLAQMGRAESTARREGDARASYWLARARGSRTTDAAMGARTTGGLSAFARGGTEADRLASAKSASAAPAPAIRPALMGRTRGNFNTVLIHEGVRLSPVYAGAQIAAVTAPTAQRQRN
jgi:hypothetical protein